MAGVEFQPYLGSFTPRFPLESLQGDKTCPRDLGLKAAKLVREQANNIGFPADLIELARLFRVSAIFYQDLESSLGWIPNFGQDQNYEVLIDPQNGYEPEQMFTLAHEVGHVVLKDSGIRLSRGDYREEFCDAFAEETLLPKDIVKKTINQTSPAQRLEIFNKLASQAGIASSVPPYLIASRLVEMGVNDIFVVAPLNNRKDMFADKHGAWGWMYGPGIKAPNYGEERKFIKRFSKLIQIGNEKILRDGIGLQEKLLGMFLLEQLVSDKVDCGVYMLGSPIPEFGIGHFAGKDLEMHLYLASYYLAQRGF